MALFVIHCLEPVQVNGDDGQRPWPFACDAIEFLGVKRPVAQLGQDIVLAKVLKVRLGLFAGRDVHQRQQHQPPVGQVVGQH